MLQPVSVLPLPVTQSNSAVMGTLIAAANPERKYYTLLPSITDTHLMEDDLKQRLNKCAFDPPTRPLTYNIPTPSSTPTPAQFGAYTIGAATAPVSPNSSVYNSGSESCPSSSPAATTKKRKKSLRSPKGGVTEVEQRRRHVCKVCSKGFTTSGHLARHNRIHTGEKNHFCPFEGCNQRFSRHDNCIQHYRTHLRKK
ncbi:hypothetical protein HG536_0C03510 [Torulaspora globosa]|uniref:C2H2-type domain-containing protein n=1 Tax=Torulaspora globosa TaxID=48254 RepID=A0A7G3ZF97_9SACH|nr:uncharacterized protein HG536_0C03510 [Torulaspora globosa]QLL32183.1 hypothetical protein HG536_0C03510 [Torulaspora globosa]